jgi:parvulin-like peptidyl-prolyl isomerase
MRAHDHAAAGTDGSSGSNQRAAPPTNAWLCSSLWLLATVRPHFYGARAPQPARGPAGQARGVSWLGAMLLVLACSELTEPPSHRRTSAKASVADAPTAPPPASPSTQVVAEKTPLVPVASDQIEASHILVSYQGATRAKPTVARTREQALELATQLAARAREPGADFAQLAKDASDGPSGVEGGVLPRFGRQQMVKPFSDAAFALRPGEISGVVETNFGFHIIKRLQ